MKYLLVGLGNIGQKRKQLLGEKCVATVDPFNPTADYVNAWDCPTDTYDAAVLSVPNQSKLDLLEFLLDKGKSVLVEKPLLFADRESAERLQQLALRRGAMWYTSYNHRFEPLIQALRRRIVDRQLGKFYYGRMFYGNGTVGNIVGTWRDRGLGVVEDLGSHLLDLSAYLFDGALPGFRAWTLERHEATATFDHCILAAEDARIVLEMSYLSWKNSFSIDLFGDRGSLHVDGLPKWGPSRLVARQRVRPSGVPIEETECVLDCLDVTWQRDMEHFEKLSATGESSFASDWWISETLQRVVGA